MIFFTKYLLLTNKNQNHNQMPKNYGKFESFDSFLESYKAEQKKEFLTELLATPRAQQPLMLKKLKDRNTAEVNATVSDDQGEEGQHYHKLLTVTSLIEVSPSVEDDVNNCLNDGLPVFLAVRYGDQMGLSEPIPSGFGMNDTLHIKGEWIPADKAFNHGGEKMSVLHFTHHPLGFICTTEKCYS
jgi:hypothetical protein